MKRKIKLAINICLILLLVVFLFLYLYNLNLSLKDKKINSNAQEIFNNEEKDIVSIFDELKKINEDVVGYIKIPNTNIDYPILQTSNNDYYLNRNLNKEKNKNGSIFLDFRNDFNSMHKIIYGHHTKDETMFTQLMNYKEKDFFNENNIIEITTEDLEERYEIFSAYVTSTDFYYIVTDFNSSSDYLKFINTLKSKSKYKTDVELTEDDYILTLSTCTYEFEDARFVVHAKKLSI